MKKKLAKVLSVMVAVVISVSAMVVNASAYSWSVSRQHSSSKPGAPIEVYGTQFFAFATSGGNVTKYQTKCTSYSSGASANGYVAHAETYAQKYDSQLKTIKTVTRTPYNFYQVSTKTIDCVLTETVYYGDLLHIYYTLDQPGVLCNISGTVTVPGGTLKLSYYI